jgi:hypothetical protein
MKSGIIGATILITSTTIDDAVWLVPYTTSSHLPLSTKVINGVTFILTLELLSIFCVGIYSALRHGLIFAYNNNGESSQDQGQQQEEDLKEQNEKISFIMECIGASLCWSIAIFLFIKKLLKRRRKRLQKQRKELEEQQLLLETSNATDASIPTLGQDAVHSYTMLSKDTTSVNNNMSLDDTMSPSIDLEKSNKKNDNGNSNGDKNDDDAINAIPNTPSILMVISFTTLGALDEISYFPALIMGNIFTPFELCVGALLAAILILSVISLFLAQCKPLVDCLDRIPLYGIVGMFAIVLTVGLFF